MAAEIYPGANTAHWYQSKYPGDSMHVNTIVWHSTEGTGLDDYQGGSIAPTLTAMPDFSAKKIHWYQHFDFDVSARALVHAGAVATNTLNVAQVEVVGTCDPSTHKKWGSTPHLYMPELPGWAVRDLAAFAKWAHDEHSVPLTSHVTWKAYPASYGANGVRLSDSAWKVFSGHCGHQHVPSGNDHGDPGLFPMAEILSEASQGSAPVQPATQYEPFPGAAWFTMGRTSPVIGRMHDRLVAVGCNKYQSSANKNTIGSGDKASYEAWQRKLGYTGSAATWPPGKTSWDELKVPKV